MGFYDWHRLYDFECISKKLKITKVRYKDKKRENRLWCKVGHYTNNIGNSNSRAQAC